MGELEFIFIVFFLAGDLLIFVVVLVAYVIGDLIPFTQGCVSPPSRQAAGIRLSTRQWFLATLILVVLCLGYFALWMRPPEYVPIPLRPQPMSALVHSLFDSFPHWVPTPVSTVGLYRHTSVASLNNAPSRYTPMAPNGVLDLNWDFYALSELPWFLELGTILFTTRQSWRF